MIAMLVLVVNWSHHDCHSRDVRGVVWLKAWSRWCV